jgi:hypothetical protein
VILPPKTTEKPRISPGLQRETGDAGPSQCAEEGHLNAGLVAIFA